MRRLLLGLSLFLVLAPGRLPLPEHAVRPPLTAVRDAGQPDDILLEDPRCARALAFAVGPAVARAPLPLPDDARMEQLARTNPLAFFKYCARRYDDTVKGYACTMQKQERINGKLQPTEVIAVRFREEPFSAFFDWQKGERLAKRTLYVRGENNGQLLARPSGLLAVAGVVKRDPEGADAKQSSRYPLTEFGIKVGTLRTIAAMEDARKAGTLRVEYLGQKKIKEAGDRVCYVLRRSNYKKIEEEGITESTYYVDKATWLQVGSTLKGAEGMLLGEYFFRDIVLNPEFKPDDFTEKALK